MGVTHAHRTALTEMPTKEASDLQPTRHLVHVFPTFAYGGVPIRIADVISRLDGLYRHSILSLDGRTDAKSRIDTKIDVHFPQPPSGRLPGLVPAIARWLKAAQPDLLLTYNWGAVEWALANRLAVGCRHIHFESGFGPEEADRQLWRRCLFRRLALGRAERLVVPSHLLAHIAHEKWHIETDRLLLLPNGVDLSHYRPDGGKRELLGEVTAPGKLLLGTVSPLRREKAIHRLLRVTAPLLRDGSAILLIAGDGAERPALEALANELGISAMTHFLGHLEDVGGFMPLLDIFCITSETEQMPNALLQAMACGRAVVASDVGDVARILSSDNQPYVLPREKEVDFTAALRQLLDDPERRRALGAANRHQAEERYDLRDMVRAYEALFLNKALPKKMPKTL